MYYTFESNKIYPVIKAGKKYFKKVDHFAPVSPNVLAQGHNAVTPVRTSIAIAVNQRQLVLSDHEVLYVLQRMENYKIY